MDALLVCTIVHVHVYMYFGYTLYSWISREECALDLQCEVGDNHIQYILIIGQVQYIAAAQIK